MGTRDVRSKPDIEDVLSPRTPTAEALYDLRKRVFATKVGPGAVKEAAASIGVDRGRLNKVITPSNIRMVAKLEEAMSGGDSRE